MKNTLLFRKSSALLFWSLSMLMVMNSQLSFSQVEINILGSSITENFNGMTSTGTSYPNNSWTGIRAGGTGTNGAILSPIVDNGNNSSGNILNLGTTSSNERALGTLASGSTIPSFGVSFINKTGFTINSINLSGVMEQWRSGASSTTTERCVFEYSIDATSINTGTWTALVSMDLVEKLTSTTAAAAVDGNAGANKTAISGLITGLNLVNNTGVIWFRWTDTDNTSSDGAYAIDDLSITATASTTFTISWSNGTPTSSHNAVIAGDFSTTASGDTAGFTAKSLTVNSGKTFTINTGHTVTVAGAITNNGTFTVNNNANLVQTDLAATNSGDIIVNKNSANIQLYDYTLWSSPVAGQKLKAFSPDTLDARFYTYNSITNQYNVVSAPATTDFATATGYLIRAPNTWTAGAPAAAFSGAFTGVPNNGTITFTGLTSSRFYAVGNPYPSTISAAAFYTENASAGTLYFWRRTNGNISTTAYATLNRAGSTTTSFGLAPSADIAVGQGFIVSPGTTTLSFKNAMRTSSNSATFLRTNEERSRFWLNLNSPAGTFCQTLLAYMPNATSEIDNGIDGRYFNDAPVALTSLIGSEEYTIQGRALPFSTSDSVPLGFKTNEPGNYTISIDHVDGLFSNGQAIYLKDNLLNTVTNLGAGSYSFASAVGTFNSRFEIVYQSMLAVNNPEFTTNNVIAFNDNDDIRINSGSTLMEQVRVFDLQGRLLVEKKQINASETRINTTAVNQVLLLEITAANGIKVTKKIIQ